MVGSGIISHEARTDSGLAVAKGLQSGKTEQVPWKKLELNEVDDSGQRLINPLYLPDGCRLKEPSRLTKAECTALLTHWRQREVEGEIPFEFSFIPLKSGSRMRAVYPKPPASEGNGEESPLSDEEVPVPVRRVRQVRKGRRGRRLAPDTDDEEEASFTLNII